MDEVSGPLLQLIVADVI